MFHQSQLPAMPFCPTSSVTASGVSAANVVATIDIPASHHDNFLPERKKFSVDPPAFFEYIKPIMSEIAK